MNDSDLFPSDFEVLMGSLTLLLREELETETKLSDNMREIETRFRKEVLPRYGIQEPQKVQTTDLIVQELVRESEKQEEPEPQILPPRIPEPPESSELLFSENDPEPSPLMKKLFKPIALLCHPDKVADAKKNRFFLLGRKAFKENDIPTVLFILSKLSCDLVLDDSELSEIHGYVERRRSGLHQKKDSFVYKWGFITEDQKKNILENIQIVK